MSTFLASAEPSALVWSPMRVVLLLSVLASEGLGGGEYYRWCGVDGGDRFGAAIANVGDVDLDGTADLLIGAPRAWVSGDRTGRAYLYSGRGSGGRFFSGEKTRDRFGASVAGAGDVDGDGAPDFIVGAPESDGNGADSGKIYVYSGASYFLLFASLGRTSGEFFGDTVAGGLDANGDGHSDILVAAPYYDGLFADSGRVDLISGSDGSLLASIEGKHSSDQLGLFIAVVDDLDGDAVRDFFVSSLQDASGAGDVGETALYSGATAKEILSLSGAGTDNRFGASVAGTGDLDSDGIGDFIVGSPRYQDQVYGRAFVYSGATFTELLAFSDGKETDNLGASVAGAGDVDGDGIPELVIGAPLASESGVAAGKVFVLNSATGELIHTFVGRDQDGRFGGRVGDAGDVDLDGRSEIMAAAVAGDHYYSGQNDGTVSVYYGLAPPELFDLDSERALFWAEEAVTLHGREFSRGETTEVLFGNGLASDVQVVDDQTIVCRMPVGGPGTVVDVTVRNQNGFGKLFKVFEFFPGVRQEGIGYRGGTFELHYRCFPGDSILSILGVPPPVSVEIAPYHGNLGILPFSWFFFVPGWRFDNFAIQIEVPDDPALRDLEFLFQALTGPDPFGSTRDASWSNVLSVVIQ